MRDIIAFFKSKQFRIHFIIAIIVITAILWTSFRYLGTYTHHNELINVPDFSSLKTEELDKFISNKQLKYEIIDSVFDSKAAKGIVVKQDPEKDTKVKQNRTIYLTISAKSAPLVIMPNLVDASMRQAQAMLESHGLKVGRREYKADPCVNCILAQMMKGKKVEPGSNIPKGSVIDLVLGKGEGDEKINIPCLDGLSQSEAIDKISESGFSEGAMICNDCKTTADKEKAKVYKQNPTCDKNAMLNPGSPIDLYLSTNATAVKDSIDE